MVENQRNDREKVHDDRERSESGDDEHDGADDEQRDKRKHGQDFEGSSPGGVLGGLAFCLVGVWRRHADSSWSRPGNTQGDRSAPPLGGVALLYLRSRPQRSPWWEDMMKRTRNAALDG